VDVDVAAAAGWRPADLALAYADGGARVIQLRAKHLPSAAFLALCDRVVPAVAAAGARVIVNDRVDLARLSGAAGAHVGQDDVPARAAREQLGPAALVGLSTHTRAQIDAALREPVSYIAVGPVFGTTTKDTGYEAVGLELVREAAAHAHLPVVAIGGVTLERARAAIDAGAAAVAVIGDLLAGGTPRERVAAYVRALPPPPAARPSPLPPSSPLPPV
jgi:thiamine-phosphate pyrophosphorylase